MKLSIITINYNNKNGLKKTISSLKNQKNIKRHNYEYIVIDGFSNDGSANLIRKNKFITNYKIEKDKGIADAFNKGINLAKGKYVYFLNSADTLYDDYSLKKILKILNDKDIYIFKIVVVDKKKNIINESNNFISLAKQKYRNYLPHQGMIIKKTLFQKYGKYDVSYKFGMDYEWSTRLINDTKNLKIYFLNKLIAKMINDGVSLKHYVKTFMSYHKARVKNDIINSIYSLIISIFFILKRSAGLSLRKSLNK
ncbi:glycosyltransferase [Pelagibacteraceae bacterium]|nr:glycosyltransferase [Pelagibacteraceae bacterium]